MTYALVVVRAFGTHRIGDVIDDADDMRKVLGSEHATRVVRVACAPNGKES